MLLQTHPEGDDDARDRKNKIVKKVFELKDIDGAMVILDRRDRLEKSILLNLRKHTNGYLNAFECIPRNTRFIYLHAY